MSTYCKPWNAGLASETPAVCKRIGRLLTALDCELTNNVVEGAIVDDIRAFRMQLITKLESEGWSVSYDGGDKVKVRQPGHKKAFRKQIVTIDENVTPYVPATLMNSSASSGTKDAK